jgi:hypothetical protein
MQVSQENGSVAGTPNAYYAADQWTTFTANGGAWTYGQVASLTPAGSPNRIRFTVTTAKTPVGAAEQAGIGTKLEGIRIADLRFGIATAKIITIQFGVKAPAGIYSVALMNAAVSRGYVAEYTIAAGEANTDVVKSVTVPGDVTGTWASDNTVGLYVIWGLMAGTNVQQVAGSWMAAGASGIIGSPNQFNLMGTVGNVFELFDVGLYEGTVAPAFVAPDFAETLQTCKRYWQRFEPLTVGQFFAGVGQILYSSYLLPVEMRIAPAYATITAPSLQFCTAAVSSTGVRSVRYDVTGSQANTQSYSFGGIYSLNARL